MQLRTEINIVMINMVVSELISAGFGSPIVVLTSLQRGWKLGKMFCSFTGFILTTDGNNRKNAYILLNKTRNFYTSFNAFLIEFSHFFLFRHGYNIFVVGFGLSKVISKTN